MMTLLKKEFGLTGEKITYIFVLAAGMAMIPNYPILVVTMIVSIGLIATFQSAREAHDTDYFTTLPIRKRDVIKAKFLFVMSIQGLAFLLLIGIVVCRMTFLSDTQAYLKNPLMNANAAYLGYTLICFAMFNSFFLTAFFKTGFTFVKPSIFYFIAEFICIGIFETLHHIGPLKGLNATTVNYRQIIILGIGMILYVSITAISYRISAAVFEKADL